MYKYVYEEVVGCVCESLFWGHVQYVFLYMFFYVHLCMLIDLDFVNLQVT